MFRRVFCLSTVVFSVSALAVSQDQAEPAKPPQPNYQVEQVDGNLYRLQVTGKSIATSEQPIKDVTVAPVGESAVQIAAWSKGTAKKKQTYYSIKRESGDWTRPRRAKYDVMFKSGLFIPTKGEPQKVQRALAVKEVPNNPQLYCVQFYTPSLPTYRELLKNRGAEVLDYVPNYCYMVRMTPETAKKVRELKAVRWVDLLHPAYKVGKNLLDEESRNYEGKKRYNVFATSKEDRKTLAEKIQEMEAGFEANAGMRTVPVELTAKQLADLLKSPLVQWVEPWQPIEKDMDNARIQGGADFLEAAATVPDGYTGVGIRGHVMEGIEATHPDFAANARRLAPIAVTDSTSDSHGHATFGIVFGSGLNDPEGKARGMLPNGQGLYTHDRALTGPTGGTGSGTRYELVGRLIDEHQVLFQTASWGNGRVTEYTSHSAEMDMIIFDHDIPITQSQSNAGNRQSRPQAWAKNIISVGGVNHANNSDPSDDSWQNGNASIGPASDGRKKPDLAAYYDATRTTDTGNGYRDFGGTSGATPIVAGHLGLVLEMWTNGDFGNELKSPGGSRFDNRPHFTTAKGLLIASAQQYEFNSASTDNRRPHQGWGFPNLRRLHENRKKLFVVDETDVLSAFDQKEYQVKVAAGEPVLKVCMTYADPQGNPAAAKSQVNDLTLRVFAPNGEEYWGNFGLENEMFSRPGGDADDVDTVECVFVKVPAPGTWKIQVMADVIAKDAHRETPELDADFALVVLGVANAEPPKLALKGCCGAFHLLEETGTAVYCYKHKIEIVGLTFEQEDEHFWYYYETDRSTRRWAIQKNCRPGCSVPIWHEFADEPNSEWKLYEKSICRKSGDPCHCGKPCTPYTPVFK